MCSRNHLRVMIGERLFGMKGAGFTCQTLHNDFRIFVD
jgi:hypothetical protein